MAINFPDSPSNGDTFTANGKTFVYNSTNTSWRPQTAAESGGTDVLADMAALIAKTGMSNGDQALVQSNNNLYMYSGSGWYKIATIQNDAPSAITGVDGSYALATDGAATTITAVSTDPEGFALTWSYTASGLGSIATVSQADNVFTVTPSTDAANAGSFTLTISATDGINGAVSTVPSFTLAFIVQNSRYTALSVKANATGSNQTFDDASASNHTITVAGNSTASTFSPHRHGGYSANFDGTGDALYTTATQVISSTTFTVSAWVYFKDTTNACVFGQGTSSGAGRTGVYVHNGNFEARTGSVDITASNAVIANRWYYLELQRDSSNVLRFFIDGTMEGFASASGAIDNEPLYIGNFSSTWTSAYPLNGYISDLRVLSSASGSNSSYSLPTEPLTAITNTTFLLGRLPYFKDQSTSNHAINVLGDASLKPKSVFDNPLYSEADHGASAYFDGTGDYLTLASSGDFAFGTGDFTIEMWVYHTDLTGQQTYFGDTYGGTAGIYTYKTTNNELSFYDNSPRLVSSANAIQLNTWHHIVWTRQSGVLRQFLDGVKVGEVSHNQNYTTIEYFIGDTAGTSSGGMEGYISDLRVIKGTAIYTSNFTPPTAPLTAVTNTTFLLNPETSISDLSQRNALICRGDVETSTTQVKFAGTKSIYFAGSDDYIHVPNSGTNSALSLNSTKFTIEGWFYKETNGNWDVIISKYRWANNLGWSFDHLSGGNFRFRYSTNGSNSTDLTTSLSSQLLTGSWAHVALVANNDLKLYINGVGEVLSASALPAFFDTSYDALIGALRSDNTDNNDGAKIMEYNGWMQDLRIHNNHAQYTADFTPPTAELEG